MDRCDVLVVGGGPAGSSCARELRRGGLDVLVLDKASFPRDKVCAGWITPAVIEELELSPEEYSRSRTLEPITGFRVGRFGDPVVEVRYGRPVSYGIRRCEFDHFLLARSGARLLLGVPFRTLRREGNLWIVNEEISTAMLVGAGGHFCPVARHIGAVRGEPIVTAQGIEVELDTADEEACRVRPEVPELYFSRDLKGYGWAFRKGRFLNLGLGRRDPDKISQHVAGFIGFLKEEGRIAKTTDGRFRGHAYLLYNDTRREPVADGMVLVGDAAGLAYDRSGEGIRPAVESGLLAARTIRAAADRGSFSRDNLQVYEAALRGRFGPRKRSAFDLAWFVPQTIVYSIAGTLLASGWFARRVLVERWFLHIHQAPLALC
jgi:geranylgeranyl reductase family protein